MHVSVTGLSHHETPISLRELFAFARDDLGGALGLSCGGRIQVLAGLEPASEFMVLVHEYAHLCIGPS